MESLIFENFKFGNTVEVIFKGSPIPLEAKFLKCYNGGVLLKSATGKKMVININEILMIRQASISPAHIDNPTRNPERSFTSGKTFIPNNQIQKDALVSDSATSISELTETDNSLEEKLIETDQTQEPSGNNLFKLPSEKPQLKILGTIELSDEDKNRPRIKKSIEDIGKPVELAENFRDTLLPAQGILKSVGPVYGYIEVPDGPDIYCNRGEFIFLPGESGELTPGIPVCFTVGSNWKGQMAKCIHQPFTIGEQLDLIENVIATDVRNARLLARQLSEAFPDSEEVADALEEYQQL